jgi:hypothetical protein
MSEFGILAGLAALLLWLRGRSKGWTVEWKGKGKFGKEE